MCVGYQQIVYMCYFDKARDYLDEPATIWISFKDHRMRELILNERITMQKK